MLLAPPGECTETEIVNAYRWFGCVSRSMLPAKPTRTHRNTETYMYIGYTRLYRLSTHRHAHMQRHLALLPYSEPHRPLVIIIIDHFLTPAILATMGRPYELSSVHCPVHCLLTVSVQVTDQVMLCIHLYCLSCSAVLICLHVCFFSLRILLV